MPQFQKDCESDACEENLWRRFHFGQFEFEKPVEEKESDNASSSDSKRLRIIT